jgi:anti-sigma factor RsiW
MTRANHIDDLDLLALADGFLDDDPVRKDEVEATIVRDPQAASRLSDYRAQNAALRAAYSRAIAEPVPERLLAIVDGAERAREQPFLRRAAAGLMIVAAGLGGWLIGYDDDDPARRALLDESYRQYVLQGPEQSVAADTSVVLEHAISWVSDDVAIRLSAPDLSSEGFSLVGKRSVRDSGDQLVALDYRSGDGRAFSLFIAPRWTDSPGPIVDRERDGVALAYWHDGPLAASIATQLPQAEARALAETVRRAMRDDTTRPPVGIEPEFRQLPNGGQDIMADTLGAIPLNAAADSALTGALAPVSSN